MGIKNDIQPGQTYGSWTVIQSRGADRPGTPIRWLCKCECGKESAVVSNTLRNGKSRVCVSCARKKWGNSGLTHGHSSGGVRTPTFQTWLSMHMRCYQVNEPSYVNYGGRGIVICDEWHKFENFLSDMGDRPSGMTIERINVNGNYEKSNCKWATKIEQARNTRASVRVTYNDKLIPLMQALSESGAKISTYSWYLTKGLSHQGAFDAALVAKRA